MAGYRGFVKALGRVRAPVLVALIVFGLGFLGAWLVGTPLSDDACLEQIERLREGSSYGENTSLWPPGTSCEYVAPNGETSHETSVPLLDYLVWAYFAAGIGFAVWAVREGTVRAGGWTIVGLVLLAGLVVLAFLSRALSVGTAVALATLWILIARDRRRRAAAPV